MNQRVSSVLGILAKLIESRIFLFENQAIIDKASQSDDPDVLDALHTHEDSEVRHAVASNPNTRGSTLNNLHIDPEHKVKSAVASNPNSPPDTLHNLFMSGHESEVVNNPALALHQIEDPSFPTKPAEEWSDETVPYKELANKTKDAHVLHILSNHGAQDVRQSVTKNPNTHPETLDKFASDASDRDDTHHDLLRNPNTSGNSLRKISKHPETEEHSIGVILRHPNVPSDVINKAARNPRFKSAALYSDHVTPEAIHSIATDPTTTDQHIEFISSHPKTSHETLGYLLNNHPKNKVYGLMMHNILHHPNFGSKIENENES